MSPLNRQKQAQKALKALQTRYPRPAGLLEAKNAFELLVATILAAQCTDARVNTVTPTLFAKWPDAQAMSNATQNELEALIRPTGFYRNKAKNLLATAKLLCTAYGGEVPHTLEAMTGLPGVARKTANVVLYGAYGINVGLAVDTHVKRIAYRLGLTQQTNPDAVEQDLILLFPREEWGNVNHRMVWFGRDVCRARNPACASGGDDEACEMMPFCPRLEPPKK